MFNTSVLNHTTPNSFELTNEEEYNRNVQHGVKCMKNKKVVICGMLRDAEKRVSAIKNRVGKMGSMFKEYTVLIVENDSKDNTRKKLLEWAKYDSRVKILGCGVNMNVCNMNLQATEGHSIDEKRIRKMAVLRNIYLNAVKKYYSNCDYMIVWDMDVIGSIYLDGVANSIGIMCEHPMINMMCANGIYRLGPLSLYYDTYAHQDINDEEFHLKNKTFYDLKKRLFDINYVRGDPPVKVESCFSGFAIYKIPAILPTYVKYGTEVKDGNIKCEHVVLHNHINNKYLNPSMIYLILHNK